MKKLKKISFVVLLVLLVFMSSACGKAENDNLTTDASGTTTVKEKIVSDNFDYEGTGVLMCTTDAEAGDDMEVDIRYTVEYKNGNILKLRSIQKVSSVNEENLDIYEDAFKSIAKNYNDLKHYDVDLTRENGIVTYDVTINYDKIDTKKLLNIEGEENNIIINGKAKLSLWLDLAERFGTICEES